MAITKTTTIQRIELYPATDSSAADNLNAKWPTFTVVFSDRLDDAEDADLPVTATRSKYFQKFVEDEGAATSYSSEDALVQAVCGAIWS